MANPDFIPTQDADLGPYANNMAAQVGDDAPDWGLTSAQNTTLQAGTTAWGTAYEASLVADAAARAATQAKEAARAALVSAIRSCNTSVQATPTVTNAMKESAGFPVYKTSRTPVPVPSTWPVLEVEIGAPQQHKIWFHDSSAPDSKSHGKPAGVSACQIYSKLGGTPPANDADWTYAVSSSRSPASIQYNSSDSGKAVYYRARWENTRHEPGPWGPMVSMVIA